LAEIKQIIAGQPTDGYRRVHALIRRRHREQAGAAVNAKRVYRVMKVHRLRLERQHRQWRETAPRRPRRGRSAGHALVLGRVRDRR